MIDFFKSLAPWGNVCSIGGLLLSVWLMFQTGRIKKSVDDALKKNNNTINYIKMRKDILDGLLECAKHLMNELPPKDQLYYRQKMDEYLADLIACYPNMTASIKKDIDTVRSSCNGKKFSYIEIVKPLHNIISILKMEAIAL